MHLPISWCGINYNIFYEQNEIINSFDGRTKYNRRIAQYTEFFNRIEKQEREKNCLRNVWVEREFREWSTILSKPYE